MSNFLIIRSYPVYTNAQHQVQFVNPCILDQFKINTSFQWQIALVDVDKLCHPLKSENDWNKDYGQLYFFYTIRSQVIFALANSAVCVYSGLPAILIAVTCI